MSLWISEKIKTENFLNLKFWQFLKGENVKLQKTLNKLPERLPQVLLGSAFRRIGLGTPPYWRLHPIWSKLKIY